MIPGRDAAPRIALVKLSSLGDVVHALPAARALRAWWPRAELTWVVERREQAVLVGNPDVNHVVAVDTRVWRREFRRLSGARAVTLKVRGLVRRLAAGRFDVAVDLQGLWKSGVITALTRAPIRVGLAATHCRERANTWFTNRRVTPSPEAVHVVDQYLAVVAALGVDLAAVGPPAFPIARDPDAEAVVTRWLEEEGVKPRTPLVLLNPGSGGDHKRWAVEAFRRLGEEVAVRLGARVGISWGPGEEPLARAIAHGMRTGALVPPYTTIAEMIALFRRASLVVGGDTGPVHVAAVLGVPTIGLYGPTSARRNGPYGPRVAAIQSPTGRMDGVSVEGVLEAAQGLLR
ncbi:MAG TPA: glycosyltransferase family 9 protein [Methylomirabilota bacterium]|nr:glycosyltransferase family 9 protein [Methylomirabilota bacterium]